MIRDLVWSLSEPANRPAPGPSLPAKDFKGDLGKSSWLLNEGVAFIYRAVATYNRPLKITSPRNDRDLVWDAGSRVTIVVDDPHAFSVLGTDSKGNIRPSNPVLVVVRKLAGTSQP